MTKDLNSHIGISTSYYYNNYGVRWAQTPNGLPTLSKKQPSTDFGGVRLMKANTLTQYETQLTARTPVVLIITSPCVRYLIQSLPALAPNPRG